jgi:DNA-binding SARP family transcriptional activator
MDFRLLGPLEVAGDDGPLPLGGTKQRSLLAMLLLHANQVVSTDRLIDALWGASPPLRCGKSIQVYVSRLRKALADDRLATHAPGYVLYVDPTELDLARFEQLVAEARRAPPESASSKLREALELWRGPPLADLAYEQFAQAEIARLEEMRLGALEQRLDADLALGRHAELVAELETLVARHPLRERSRYQLMLALYRSERQADALQAYRQARQELSDELGLEPSESLKQLEAAILRQDPGLALAGDPARVKAAPAAAAPERAVLVAPTTPDALDSLLSFAKPLAQGEPARELIVATVVDAESVPEAAARLALARDELMAEGFASRTAAFSSPAIGDDVARLAAQEGVDLLVMDAGEAPLAGAAATVLERAPCDVALVLPGSGPAGGGGPVVVPFGAAGHDWAALELGAWLARTTGAPLRLVGAADRRRQGRDASRLLADASLIVQRTAGIVAEPVLAASGRRGVAEVAKGAGALIVGLSERWREEGLGRARSELASRPPAPTVFVRRGARPGGLAPAETRTRFSWSIEGTAA